MVAWLYTLKTVAPLAADLVAKALPAFTSRRGDKAADVVPQQIAELQGAATENADAIKLLAAQLQKAVAAIEEGAQGTERRVQQLEQTVASSSESGADVQRTVTAIEARLRRATTFAVAGLAVAAASLCLALYAWASRA